MSNKTETKVIGDLILAEYDERLTRDAVTFRQTSGSTASYKIGQTLKLSGGKYLPDDGSAAAAVLLKNLDSVADSTDVLGVPVLMRGPAIISQDQLVFDAGADATEQAAQIAAMLTRNIRAVREPAKQTVAGT